MKKRRQLAWNATRDDLAIEANEATPILPNFKAQI